MTRTEKRNTRRDPADWVPYGSPRGRGRPKIGTSVSATVPDDQVARLDEIAAGRGLSRQDVLREAVAEYVRNHAEDRSTT